MNDNDTNLIAEAYNQINEKKCPSCGDQLKSIGKKEWGGTGRLRCKGCGKSFHKDDVNESYKEIDENKYNDMKAAGIFSYPQQALDTQSLDSTDKHEFTKTLAFTIQDIEDPQIKSWMTDKLVTDFFNGNKQKYSMWLNHTIAMER